MQINQLPVIPQAPSDADVLAIEVNGVTYKVSKSVLTSAILASLSTDSVPTEGSTKPVQSGGVYAAITESLDNTIADAYSSSATYAVDDYCIYNNTLYKCNTAITTAEAWTPAHWTATSITEEFIPTSDVVNNLTSTATDKPLSAAQGKALSEAIAQSTAKTYYESTSFSQAIADAGLTAPYLTEALNTIDTDIGSITANAVQNQTVRTNGPVCFAVYAKVNDTYYAGTIFTYYYNPAVYGFYRKGSTYGVKAL